MKKVVLSAMLACSVFASGEVYSEQVKEVYADAVSKDAIGKLLPTNAVKILAKEGGRVKIEVRGYVNPDVPSVINFSDSQRVFTLAFSKTANFKTEVIKKGVNGKWDLVKTIVYTNDSGFVSDVKPMMMKAAEIYKTNCGVCHGLHDTTHFKANQWPGLLKSMLSRTAIEKKDEWLVTQYLQKHSADVNIK